MNKIPCNTIRDLLVLYEDNVCSEESRQIIEEHITECEECRELYEKTKASLPKLSFSMSTSEETYNTQETPAKDFLDEQWNIISEAFKKLQHKITIRHLIFAGILLFIAATGTLIWTCVFDQRLGVVPPENIQSVELYELENGDIFCSLETKKPFHIPSLSFLQVPPDYWDKDCDEGWYEISLQYPVFLEKWETSTILHDKVYFIMPQENTCWTEEGDTITHSCRTVYFSGRNDDRRILWQKGQTLTPAPKELEEKIATYKTNNSQNHDIDPVLDVIFPFQLGEPEKE